MKKYLIILTVGLFMAACGGDTSSSAENKDAAENSTASDEATSEDLQQVEESQQLKQKANDANAKVDSILNNL